MKNIVTLAVLALAGSAIAQSLPAPPVSPPPVVNYEYDAEGNPTKTVQAPGVLGFETRSRYDRLNRVQDSTDAKSGVVRYGYDGLDRTLQVTDPRNLVTQYPRNGLGDAKQLVSPDTGTAAMTYDAAGNLKTRTDSRGVQAFYSYDAMNRLTAVGYSKSGQTSQGFTWQYDVAGVPYGIGRLGVMNFPGGQTRFAYNPQGDVVTVQQGLSPNAAANATQLWLNVGYGYTAGRLTSITYPSGRQVGITYTSGEPTAITLAASASATPVALISQIEWEPFGPAKGWNWQTASGPKAHQRVYDLSGRVVRYPLGPYVRDLTYDAADRISAYTHYDAVTGASDPTLNQAFGNDELGRLTQVTLANTAWSFAYDANGNRTAQTVNGSTSDLTIATTSNRISAISNPNRTFSYDNAGNTTADGQFSATYDLSGRMSTLTKAGVTTTYLYDNDGKRVRKHASTGPASTVVFVYDLQGQLLGEYDSAGKAIREYVWLGSTPVAVFSPDAVNAANPPVAYFIHTDHIDTPRVVLDKNNQVRWRWFSEPFGVNVPEGNPSGLGTFTLNLRFPGQYFDQESGLHYNWHRSYDASVGRYTTSDPIGLSGGINTYTYVDGDPLSFIDPEGLAACTVLFPDYPIEYAEGKTSTWLGGHGGVLAYDANGVTQYYEYGRYPPSGPGIVGARLPADDGNVRRVGVPNLILGKDGQPTSASMENLRVALSQKAGRGTQADLTCDAKADEKKVVAYAQSVANDKNRPKYSWKPWNRNQCHTFSRRAFEAGR